jgi:hypothetical protein
MAAATAFGHRLGLLSDWALLGSGGHLIGEFHLTDPGWIYVGTREMCRLGLPQQRRIIVVECFHHQLHYLDTPLKFGRRQQHCLNIAR